MTVGETVDYGPGTLIFGETGTTIDASCLVNSLRITTSKTQGDTVTKLCGTQRTPRATYTYTMSGNLDIDATDPAGLFALSQLSPGTEVPFVYVPNTEAETEAAGVVIVDPMDFGGEEYGETMNSDVEWTLTGPPEYSMAGVPLGGAPLDGDMAELDAAPVAV